jgi:hypothetical protein
VPSREAAMISAGGPTCTSVEGALTTRYCKGGSRLTVGAAKVQPRTVKRLRRVENFISNFSMGMSRESDLLLYPERKSRHRNGV